MPSSNVRESPPVKPARLIHLPRMLLTHHRGLHSDPMLNYIYNTDIEGGFTGRWGLFICTEIFIAMFTVAYLFKRTNYQIGGGLAFITIGSAGIAPPADDRLMGWILSFIMWAHATFATPEQRSRDAEYNTKKQTLLAEVLPDKYKYAVISILVADPCLHGKGYGRTLMQTVCALADARQEKLWLTSTNAKNRSFYESSGFNVIGSLTIGDDNPAWAAPPSRIDIMTRHPEPLPEIVSH
ncbi:unnamed protein product [Peniophora sp. CBMAI 1063]|nr:unnamed protein product [Peniophora sp. CBMAI 1063]